MRKVIPRMTTYKYTPEQQAHARRLIRAGRKVGRSIHDFPVEIQEANREYFLKYDRARWEREAEERKRTNPDGVHRPSRLIKEDGIIDWLAIEITVKGERVVDLTPTERNLAIARLVRAGYNVTDIAQRVDMNRDSAAQLVNKVKKEAREAKILTDIEAGKYEQSAA